MRYVKYIALLFVLGVVLGVGYRHNPFFSDLSDKKQKLILVHDDETMESLEDSAWNDPAVPMETPDSEGISEPLTDTSKNKSDAIAAEVSNTPNENLSQVHSSQENRTDKNGPKANAKTEMKPEKKILYKYISQKISSELKSEPMLGVVLKVELIYSNKALESELNFKGRDLEAVIENILQLSEREELYAPALRNKIKSNLNDLLYEGQIEDVIFTDFKIEILQSDN